MRFFRWLRGISKRAITSLPWSQGGAHPSAYNAERALSLIPLFACVRILADMVAALPIQTYRRTGDQRQPQTFVPDLLWRPAARDNLFEWLHKLMFSLTLRGNAYGLVTHASDAGFPDQIEWLHPDDVYVDETRPTMPVYYWQGQVVPSLDMVHIAWVVPPGRVVGLSPVQAFASTIGVGLSATEYGKRWFDNGGVPPATMKNNQQTIAPPESEEISDRLAARMRAGKPLVYGSDWEFQSIQVNPDEAQFIATMKMNATQIAAIFGIPPEMVGGESGGSLTYNSPEQNVIYLTTVTLRPWLKRIEDRISELLPGNLYAKFNADAMIRVDTLGRYQAHHIALTDGWKSKDEIRAIEDLGPLPNGQGAGYAPTLAAPPRTPQNPAEPPPARQLESAPGLNGHVVKELTNG